MYYNLESSLSGCCRNFRKGQEEGGFALSREQQLANWPTDCRFDQHDNRLIWGMVITDDQRMQRLPAFWGSDFYDKWYSDTALICDKNVKLFQNQWNYTVHNVVLLCDYKGIRLPIWSEVKSGYFHMWYPSYVGFPTISNKCIWYGTLKFFSQLFSDMTLQLVVLYDNIHLKQFWLASDQIFRILPRKTPFVQGRI